MEILIPIIILAVISFAAWVISKNKQEESSEQQEAMRSLSNVEVRYDKFQDETTVTYGSRFDAVFKLKIGAAVATGPHQLVFKGTDSSGRERDVTLTLVVSQ